MLSMITVFHLVLCLTGKNKSHLKNMSSFTFFFSDNEIDKEAFYLLDSESLKEIIPAVGLRLKVLKKLKLLKVKSCTSLPFLLLHVCFYVSANLVVSNFPLSNITASSCLQFSVPSRSIFSDTV